tara:strand:+ start:407 stop:730 length:324 start_codon:yes stop_codon:yes gene_type:complete
MEIRHNRLSRDEGLKLAKFYDKKIPENLEFYLEFLKINKKYFFNLIDKMSEKIRFEKIIPKIYSEKKIIKDYIFSKKNKNLYFNPDNPPSRQGNDAFDKKSLEFYGY